MMKNDCEIYIFFNPEAFKSLIKFVAFTLLFVAIVTFEANVSITSMVNNRDIFIVLTLHM